MATTNIVDKDGNSIGASDATVPSDRLFRNCLLYTSDAADE